MENELRGAVLTKFRSISDFAKALEWDRKKASRIINHVQSPTVDDMYKMSELLGIKDSLSFCHIFLPRLTTKWES